MTKTLPEPARFVNTGADAARAKQRRELGSDRSASRSRARSAIRTTRAWKQGAAAEMQTARKLDKHLRGSNTIVLHDRRIPRRGRANIDHLAIGPAGVTVIDTKSTHGRLRLTKVGGLSPRRELLLVNGRDRTAALDGLERQMSAVAAQLVKAGLGDVDVRGALCYPNIDRLPLVQPRVRHGTVIIGDPRAVARFAKRRGTLNQRAVQDIAVQLARPCPSRDWQ